MYRRSVATALLALCLALSFSGCKSTPDQQSQQTPPAPEGNSSTLGSASSSAPTPAPAPAPPPQPIIIAAGTAITVVADQTLSSKTSTTGQSFTATLQQPVEVQGRLAIPKGAHASGIVEDAKSAGKFKGGAVLAVALTSVTVNGTSYEVQTSTKSQASKGKGKRTAGMIGGGGAGGALIGGLAGGGKGALIGGLIGAGAGTAGAALTGNDREITIPVETVLTFKLQQPLEIKPKP